MAGFLVVEKYCGLRLAIWRAGVIPICDKADPRGVHLILTYGGNFMNTPAA
jgi:hypothetical protein